MFYPHQSQFNNVNGYRLASTSDYDINSSLGIYSSVGVSFNGYFDRDLALRPVVCINENQKLDVKE